MRIRGLIKKGMLRAGLLTRPVEVPPPVRELDDGFLTWARFAVAGHPSAGNPFCMDHAIRHMPDGAPIVEIGSFAGLSAVQMCHLARKHGRTNRLIACDPWMFEGLPPGITFPHTSVTSDGYREYVRESFARNVRFFCADNLPAGVEMTSDDFFAAWRERREVPDVVGGTVRLGGPIGFCFIDGNHTYECAARDFRNVDEFLAPGGFVLFDDSGDGQTAPDGQPWGSCRAAREVLDTGRYELVMKNPNYLYRKR